MSENRRRVNVIGTYVDVTSYDNVIENVWKWAHNGESRAVSFSTVHVCMEGHKNKDYQRYINSYDLVVPDGMPLYWMQRLNGYSDAQRTTAPDSMAMVLDKANADGMPVGLYGCSEKQLERLLLFIQQKYPKVNIVYHLSPPFRKLTPEEDAQIINDINNSGCRILFVSLGCPKQEVWIGEHLGKIQATMLTVGASFNFLSGDTKRAPMWLQKIGLEWFYRFCCEPRRLAYRYWVLNPWFLGLSFLQIFHLRKF